MKRIYFDHSATTPVDPQVLRAMLPYLKNDFGNASSLHFLGQRARAGVEKAREQVAKFLVCEPKEIIFTSGATESNNLALIGFVRRARALDPKRKVHVITSAIEHPAILEVCRELKKEEVDVTFLPVSHAGLVRVEDVKKAIRPETILISIMYVNNEVGTVQPIQKIGKFIRETNLSREKQNKIYFHTDAVQAANFCDCRVDFLGVDMLSLSAHKIYGPKGTGILFVREGTPLFPIIFGGHQEWGVRSGTENVAGIVGLGKAVELLNQKSKLKSQNLKIKKLRDKLVREISKKIPDAILNGDLEHRVPGNLNFCFKNVEGESILLMLDMEGIALSTGSACSSGSLEPSHVLTAMGVSPIISHGSVRITLGKNNTEEEVRRLVKILPGIVARLRKMSPIKK
ncbi:MAG: cysteine desulfurase family protein [Patescibacteria group bacterium]|jgi:cysteine desulfurase